MDLGDQQSLPWYTQENSWRGSPISLCLYCCCCYCYCRRRRRRPLSLLLWLLSVLAIARLHTILVRACIGDDEREGFDTRSRTSLLCLCINVFTMTGGGELGKKKQHEVNLWQRSQGQSDSLAVSVGCCLRWTSRFRIRMHTISPVSALRNNENTHSRKFTIFIKMIVCFFCQSAN